MSQKHVAALLIARNKISSSRQEFICNSLDKQCAIADEIRSQINKDLGDNFSLSSWLMCEKNIDIHIDENCKYKIRATRIAWIDAMIEYWRDKP